MLITQLTNNPWQERLCKLQSGASHTPTSGPLCFFSPFYSTFFPLLFCCEYFIREPSTFLIMFLSALTGRSLCTTFSDQKLLLTLLFLLVYIYKVMPCFSLVYEPYRDNFNLLKWRSVERVGTINILPAVAISFNDLSLAE